MRGFRKGRQTCRGAVCRNNLHLIGGAKIIQEEKTKVRMRIVRGEGYREEDTEALLDSLKEVLGPDVAAELEFVDEIPRTASGKFRWVISKVPLEI